MFGYHYPVLLVNFRLSHLSLPHSIPILSPRLILLLLRTDGHHTSQLNKSNKSGTDSHFIELVPQTGRHTAIYGTALPARPHQLELGVMLPSADKVEGELVPSK